MKISKKEDAISGKEFQSLKEQVKNIDQNLKDLTKKSNSGIVNLDKRFDQKIEDLIMIIDQKLEEQISLLDQKFNEQVTRLTEKLDEINEKLGNLANEVSTNLENIQDQVQNQKDDNISLNNEINELITKTNSKVESELEDIRGQQDVLKVSFDVLEKKILEEAKSMIYSEVRLASKDKEDEILMNMWIDELKEIINDFDKLKEMNPKDLKIQIDEISNLITSFKKKIV